MSGEEIFSKDIPFCMEKDTRERSKKIFCACRDTAKCGILLFDKS